MSHAQDNFDRAVDAGVQTLKRLSMAAESEPLDIDDAPTSVLQSMAHDLDAIAMSLHATIQLRPGSSEPQDWG